MKSAIKILIILFMNTVALAAERKQGFFLHDMSGQSRVFHELYDESTGKSFISPFGQKEFPFAAIAEIKRSIFMVSDGDYALSLGKVLSAYDLNEDIINEALKSPFIAADSSFIYLDSDMATVVPVSDAAYVLIPDVMAYDLESLYDVAWNECSNKHFTGQLRGFGRCRRGAFMSDRFRVFMEKNLLSCVNVVMGQMKGPQIKSIFVLHDGTAGDASHQRTKSLHNSGHAIDIRELHVWPNKRGSKKALISYEWSVKNQSSWQFGFYKRLRTCWGQRHIKRDSNCRAHNKRQNIAAGLNYQASIGWEDSRHKHHLHLSMPFCSGRNKSIYNSI